MLPLLLMAFPKIPHPEVHLCCLFSGCSSLTSLPDISKWNIENAVNIYGLFSGCSSLNSLPDISKWDTKNVTNMRDMFYGCRNIIIPKKFLNK
jgi:surface protein